jgi:hypothetical protein
MERRCQLRALAAMVQKAKALRDQERRPMRAGDQDTVSDPAGSSRGSAGVVL